MADERARARRGGSHPGLRTAAVQAVVDGLAERRSAELGRPLRVLDLGGGTGGIAVPLAAAGHDVTVVDPSPDALASLRRRAAETGTVERVHPVQGDTDTVGELTAEGSGPGYDLVCLHGTLEVVDDPDTALANVAGVLAPAAPSRSSSRSGSPPCSRGRSPASSPGPAPSSSAPTGAGATTTPPRAGSTRPTCSRSSPPTASRCSTAHGVRIFSDLVPSALVDSEADRTALLELEEAASRHPDHPLLGALGSVRHVLATRD